MAGGFTQLPSGVWTPQRTAYVARNLSTAFDQASPNEQMLGAQFYPHWNEDAQYLADRMGQTPAHAAAMMARLSPSTEAEMNRMMAYQLADLGSDSASHIRRAVELGTASRQFAKDSPEQTALLGQAAAARDAAGLKGTPLSLQSSTNLAFALDHRDGVFDDPLNHLGRVKINDFGHAINDPLSERQTIDTHYHDAAVNRTDIPYKVDRGLSAVGRYENFQHAAAIAHQTAAPDLAPNAFMGAVWYQQQQKKVNDNPAAARARKASESRISNFRGGSWDPAVHGQRPSLNHISTED